MKKIVYYLSFLLVVFLVTSCDEEDYKGINISQDDREVDIKQFIGDLTGHIVIKNALGETVTDVDMGQTFYLIDNTEGGVDDRTWTITQGTAQITSNEQLVRINLEKPGDATISLNSKRSSDGKSVSSNVTLPINKIPVTADFITDPAEEGGVATQFMGYPLIFTSVLEGSPTIFDWEFVGPETLTSDEQNPTIIFTKPGVYDVTFTASRDDGAEGITKDVVEKTGYLVIEQLNIEVIRAVVTDNKLRVKFNHAIDENVPTEVASEFAITIKTKAGGNLTPAISNVVYVDEYQIELAFADKMYSDDEVFLTYTSAGYLKDATGVGTFVIDMEPCVYGHNLWNLDVYSFVTGHDNWRANDDPGAEISNDIAYHGQYSLKIDSKAGSGFSSAEAFGPDARVQLEFGQAYVMSWKLWRDPASTDNVLGPWLRNEDGKQQQYWTGLNSLPKGEWITITKEFEYGDKPNHGTGASWWWTRVKDNNLVYIDDIQIVIPNPRP